MRFTIVSLLFAGLAAAAPVDTSVDVDLETRQINPDLRIIGAPVANGNGCPKGTASIIFDNHEQTFTISFDQYTAQTGPAPLKPSDSIKNCKVTMLVGFTKGYTFSILETELNGYASLTPGVTGKAITQFSFTGGTGNPKYTLNFKGPHDDTFNLRADPSVIVNSRCGAGSATLNINTQITLNPLAPSSKKGLIGVTDLQGVLRQKFHYRWTRCP